jgi:CRP-like cAMP-binding protein
LRTSDPPEQILLNERQRLQLAQIAMRVRLPPRTVIYRESSTAHSVFAVADGVVKCFRELRSGKRVVGAFLFANDIFGLAENGRYTNCAQAITSVTLYRLPLPQLTVLLKHDGDMQFQFLAKVTHELRQAQRRTVVISRRDAVGRLAMFIGLMSERAAGELDDRSVVPLPMTRSDIGDYLGLSLESVSRAATALEKRGTIRFEGRHTARILDPAGFARLVAAV